MLHVDHTGLAMVWLGSCLVGTNPPDWSGLDTNHSQCVYVCCSTLKVNGCQCQVISKLYYLDNFSDLLNVTQTNPVLMWKSYKSMVCQKSWVSSGYPGFIPLLGNMDCHMQSLAHAVVVTVTLPL